MPDEILDEIARVRAKLLETHGGIDGYFQYLQKMDQARLEREKTKKSEPAKRKRPARTRKT